MVLSSRPFELTLKGGKGSSDEYIFFLGRLSGHGPEFQDRDGGDVGRDSPRESRPALS